MAGDGERDKDRLRARGITCVLQTHFSSLFYYNKIQYFLFIKEVKLILYVHSKLIM